jgi:hypothetical protein
LQEPDEGPGWQSLGATCLARRSFRNKNAGGSAALFWNDIWIADVMSQES